MSFARCEALLRSGTQCRSAAVTNSAFCSHHATLVEEIGEERVRSGDHPPRRKASIAEPVTADVETSPTSSNGAIDPAEIRPRLAALAADALPGIQAAHPMRARAAHM
jgi:hypothetical protein